LIGTPAYWSPEQARGEKATERSDVFALGMMACDLFGVERPRFGDGERAARDLPGPIGKLVARCLSVDPRERPFPAEVAHLLEKASEPRIASLRTTLMIGAIGAIGASILAIAIDTFRPSRFESPVIANAPVQTAMLRRLDAVEELRRAKGLSVSDVRGHAELMVEARRAIEANDIEAARSAIATMEVRLDRIAIEEKR